MTAAATRGRREPVRRLGGHGPLLAAAVALVALVVPAVSSLAREAVAQAGVFKEDRLAGLQWTFVRVKYTPTTGDLAMRTRFGFWDDPWAIDAPAAEQNLSRRVQTATAIEVGRAAGHGARRPAALAVPVALPGRAEQPGAQRRRGGHAARVPAARRHR